MTCNECIHYDACRNLLELFNPELKGKTLNFTKSCEHFKNKSDFVEVVRCKECKHWKAFKPDSYCKGECKHENNGMFDFTLPEDFCSYGERRNT